MNDILLNYWYHSLEPFDVNFQTANQIFDDLTLAYSQPHRYYHTLQHIYHVLTIIEKLKDYSQDLSTIKLAAWFHDIVYDTHASNNEETSAEYAGKMLKTLAIPDDKITKIQQLILNTKNHHPENRDSEILLDADLGIFATDEIQYQQYTQYIRQEYAWVNHIDYIQGRSKILTSFLQRSSIYFTPLMLEFAEARARINIETEILNLQS